jgi:hypothetical protein
MSGVLTVAVAGKKRRTLWEGDTKSPFAHIWLHGKSSVANDGANAMKNRVTAPGLHFFPEALSADGVRKWTEADDAFICRSVLGPLIRSIAPGVLWISLVGYSNGGWRTLRCLTRGHVDTRWFNAYGVVKNALDPSDAVAGKWTTKRPDVPFAYYYSSGDPQVKSPPNLEYDDCVAAMVKAYGAVPSTPIALQACGLAVTETQYDKPLRVWREQSNVHSWTKCAAFNIDQQLMSFFAEVSP